jgi:hypothetical protein
MIKITTNTGIIPTKSHLRDVVQMSAHPEKMTEGANVSRGVFEGHTVALKKPRHHSRKGGPGAVPSVSGPTLFIATEGHLIRGR